MKILVIEDSVQYQVMAEEALKPIAEVYKAGTLGEARLCLSKEKFDLLLLDISLPDGDGISFFNEIVGNEEWKKIPVLFVTGKNETPTKIVAFNMGAIDYIAKPFDPLELRARVESHLKRACNKQEVILNFGPMKLDSSRFVLEVKRDGDWKPVNLTTTEFKILWLLCQRPGVIFTREQILNFAWGDGVHVSDRNVDSHVSSLRRKMKELGKGLHSVRGMGYRIAECDFIKTAA